MEPDEVFEEVVEEIVNEDVEETPTSIVDVFAPVDTQVEPTAEVVEAPNEVAGEPTLDDILTKAVDILAERETLPEVIWTTVVSIVAARYGWTLDEASENMANLLNSL